MFHNLFSFDSWNGGKMLAGRKSQIFVSFLDFKTKYTVYHKTELILHILLSSFQYIVYC